MNSTDGPYEYNDHKETENFTVCVYYVWTPSLTIIPVLYMLIFILGLLGNGMVIFTVWRAQGKRRVTDVYIGNLALADLTFAVTLPLWAIYTAMSYHWPFGAALCKISTYLINLNMYASIFCFTCMSFNFYLSIVHSLSSTQLRAYMRVSLIAIWLLSGLLAAPILIFRNTKHDYTSNITFCAMDFSLVATNQRQESLWVAGLRLSSSAFGFLLPLLVMMVCYGFIGCTVTRHFNNLHKDEHRKRRLLKIITMLVVVFAVCWMPFHVVKIADALDHLNVLPHICNFLLFQPLVRLFAECLASFNSCINPFLYAFFDPSFRSQCLRLFCGNSC